MRRMAQIVSAAGFRYCRSLINIKFMIAAGIHEVDFDEERSHSPFAVTQHDPMAKAAVKRHLCYHRHHCLRGPAHACVLNASMTHTESSRLHLSSASLDWDDDEQPMLLDRHGPHSWSFRRLKMSHSPTKKFSLAV